MFKCLIDGTEFETELALHNYISRKLKVKLEEYYPKYLPRVDLFTGEQIKFKSKEFYLSSLFNTRESLVEYFKTHRNDITTAKEVIRLRNEAKNFTFAPSTVEGRTSIMPTPLLISRLGHNYNEICEELGIPTRYDYEQELSFEEENELHVLVDTREQKPLKIAGGTIVSKLDFGDYACRSHYKRIFIERKSLVDCCGTLSQGFERFQNELQRAADLKAYIVVCVEDNLLSLNNLKERSDTKHMKATSEFLGARLRSLCQDFGNVQFLFVDGRIRMSQIVEKIFRLNNNIRTVDLQYYYDLKQL